jgi:hypothetical protein
MVRAFDGDSTMTSLVPWPFPPLAPVLAAVLALPPLLPFEAAWLDPAVVFAAAVLAGTLSVLASAP